MWQEAEDGNLTVVSSPILVIEVLVKPLRDRNTEIEMQYRELFASNGVRLLDASYQVFEDAARLRKGTGLRHLTRFTRQQPFVRVVRSSSPTIQTSVVSRDCL